MANNRERLLFLLKTLMDNTDATHDLTLKDLDPTDHHESPNRMLFDTIQVITRARPMPAPARSSQPLSTIMKTP